MDLMEDECSRSDKLIMLLRIDLVNIIGELKRLKILILSYISFRRIGHSPGAVSVQRVDKIICDHTSASRFKIIRRHKTKLKWFKILQIPKRMHTSHGLRKYGNIKRKKKYC